MLESLEPSVAKSLSDYHKRVLTKVMAAEREREENAAYDEGENDENDDDDDDLLKELRGKP